MTDDGTALISRNQTISYDELNEQVAGCAAGWPASESVDGDRVALICGNGHPFVVGYFAALGLGAVVVPLNPTSPAPELQRELAAVEPVVAISIAAPPPAGVTSTPANFRPCARVISVDGDAADETPSRRSLEAEPVAVSDVDPDHLAVLMFTSGTAGAPRAAMLTHGNLLSNLEQARSTTNRVSADDVVYGVHPAVPHLRAQRGPRP